MATPLSVERLLDARIAHHRRPATGWEQRGGRLGRGEQLGGVDVDTGPAQSGHVLGNGRTGVVGDEHHLFPGVVETPDRLRGTGDGVARQPDDAVKIKDPEHPGSLLRRQGSATMNAVPRFRPFPGLRYSRSHVASLDDVVCPPYDVISESERLALEARSPSNIVRLELPHDDGEGDRYLRAASLLDAWRDGGILRRDSVRRSTATGCDSPGRPGSPARRWE